MLTWIDNTGLHGAGRSLTRSAMSAYDLESFLQLAVLIVFSQRIEWGNFESLEVERSSEQFHAELIGLGVDKELIGHRPLGEGSYRSACAVAGMFAVKNLSTEFRPGARAAAGIP